MRNFILLIGILVFLSSCQFFRADVYSDIKNEYYKEKIDFINDFLKNPKNYEATIKKTIFHYNKKSFSQLDSVFKDTIELNIINHCFKDGYKIYKESYSKRDTNDIFHMINIISNQYYEDYKYYILFSFKKIDGVWHIEFIHLRSCLDNAYF